MYSATSHDSDGRTIYVATFRDPLTGETFAKRWGAFRRAWAYARADEYAEQLDCDMIRFQPAR